MILTIGMIVKNEEKYLRSCLEALKPLLTQVDSELIIADTGSTDATVEIAKEFTDQVFYFKWCDDFSAARNSTLERARGKWFMAVDGDEIFRDVSEIVAFFNSGEYRNYRTATYIQRNIKDKYDEIFFDVDVLRMTRIEKDTRYANRIHEAFPFRTPVKRLFAPAEHFGYLFDNNKEFLEQKAARNIELLIQELENDSENCKYYLELGQAYGLAKDQETALSYREKGFSYAKTGKHSLLNAFYADLARNHFEMEHYSQTIRIAEEYFREKTRKSEIDPEMYYLEASSHYLQKNYGQAAVSYCNYLNSYDAYHKGKLRSMDSLRYAVKYTDSRSRRIAAMSLLRACMREKDYDLAGTWLRRLPLALWSGEEKGQRGRLSLELEWMSAVEDFTELPDRLLQAEGKVLTEIQLMLEQMLRGEKRNLILAAAASSSELAQTDYGRLLKLRYDFWCRNTLDKEEVRGFLSEITQWTALYADGIYFALYCGIELPYLASKIDGYELETLLFNSAFFHFQDLPVLLFQKTDDFARQTEPVSRLWTCVLLLWAMASGQLTEPQLKVAFCLFSETSGAFLKAICKEGTFAEEAVLFLPPCLRAGYFCSRAEQFLKSGNKAAYVRDLKRVLGLEPGLKDVILLLLKELQQTMDGRESGKAVTEYERYAHQVKENIRTLMGQGLQAQAGELLASYGQLCPNDPELEVLSGQLKQARLN